MAQTDPDAMILLLVQVSRSLRASALAQLAKLGLHPGQEFVLMQLFANDGQGQTALAERLGVQAPTVTKMLQRLEAGGFVERRVSAADNRVTLVYLSERGRALEKPLRQTWARLERQVTGGLNAHEREQLAALLRRVRANLGPPDDGEVPDCGPAPF